MVEFFGTRIKEQELERIYDECVVGIGRCQVLLEFASTVEDRVFALAAKDAFVAIIRECVRVLP